MASIHQRANYLRMCKVCLTFVVALLASMYCAAPMQAATGMPEENAVFTPSTPQEEPNAYAKIPQSKDGPATVVEAYLAAMKAHNINPELPIYSAESKILMRAWKTTPQQLDALTARYAGCTMDRTRYEFPNAVVRFGQNERTCCPFFLVFEDNDWRLDLASMMKIIHFNKRNEWYLDMNIKNNYVIAFADWNLDRFGVPAEKKSRLGMKWQTFSDPASRTSYSAITQVDQGSAAQTAGFQAGDIISRWNDVNFPAPGELTQMIETAKAGSDYTAIIQRGTTQYTLSGKTPDTAKH